MALLAVRLRYSFVLCLPLRRIAILTGYSGTCRNGTCQTGNLLDTAKVIVTPCPFLTGILVNRSLIPSFFPRAWGILKGLVPAKLTDFHSSHSRCGPARHYHTLGRYQ